MCSRAEPIPAPIQLLENMAESSAKVDFKGEFVYQSGGNLQTFKIVHQSLGDNQSAKERIVDLDGPPRGVIRSNGQLIFSDRSDGVTKVQSANLISQGKPFSESVV